MLWAETGEYLEEQIKAKERMYEFNHLRPREKEKRTELLKEMFGSVGESVWVEPPISYARGKTVSFGNFVYVNSGLTLVDDWKISIGNHVLISPNVTIVTCGHPVHPALRPNGEMYCFPVIIEDWVWIGSNVTILPGVTIGKGSVIGAGSVVTKDIPSNVVAFGNPCRAVREITDEDKVYYYKNHIVDGEWLNREK